MSMFKSLQGMPGVITIFHSGKSQLSSMMLHKLEVNASDKLRKATSKDSSSWSSFFSGKSDSDDLKYNYQIDIARKIPTPEQFQFIKSTLSMNPSYHVLDLQDLESGRLVELQSKTLEELSSEGVFQPPLVVDWDNKLIAADMKSLDKILKNYDKNEEGLN
ncbi:hypothetical protein CANARDRAFT_21279 [[Candida] arabinofermentans NRRL YB-2248]|uniref:Glutaredoxin domain-containing protein n=1 Tax=[Candida] arabinofermentans NRRL YB-2248 TaxID=983967 RepID=A0A1E4T6F7_9ASCO|nr:hypothetical protein CANARDRAFT_21279 [[Candida] arabinofermentans NRRL YB-2248]